MNPPSTPWIRRLVLLMVGLGLIGVLITLSEVVQLLVVAAFLAYLISPLASRIESYGMNRTVATIAVFAVLMATLLGFLYYLYPLVVEQAGALQSGVRFESAEQVINDVEYFLEERLFFLALGDLQLSETIHTLVVEQLADFVDYVPGVVSILANVFLVPFVMFFLIKDGHAFKQGFVDLVPNRYFEFTLNVLHKMDIQLGNYLRGQFLVALIVGALSTLVLWYLKVDFYLIIGPFAGLANIIPYVGPFVGAVAAILVSVITTGAFDTVLPILGSFIAIQLIDNTFLSPLIIARNVRLHPITVLIAILVGGKLFGLLGLLLAVPCAAVLKVVLTEMVTNARRYRFA